MERPNAIPTSPGVYLYKDKGGRIIYVGKARNLKKTCSFLFPSRRAVDRKNKSHDEPCRFR